MAFAMISARGRSWSRALVGLLAAIAVACSSHTEQTFNPDDPFDDPFFAEEFGSGDSLDEVWNQPAPSVGSLASGEDAEAHLLAEHSDPIWGEGEGPLGDELAPGKEKTFSDKASEAAVATMSVLFAAGMTALPYLVGAY
jgi:hypothetical protein